MASAMNYKTEIIFTDNPRADYNGIPACRLDDPFEYCIYPKIIVHPPTDNQLTAFVNMSYRPTTEWIQKQFEIVAKILKGDNVKVENLHFKQWSDGTTGEKGVRSTDAYYCCDMIDTGKTDDNA